ncbi:helix-turn-helix domain-containing protein [Micromonospora maritima]|uniref:Helix-turn-helix domain-containing protein n=1 Tax=Micromonospora maritima TaxID=986711 RepID=A0ABW7ZTL1_9ACTN
MADVTNPDPEAEWWTTSDVAAYLGVRVGTVATYRKRGQMPAPDLTLGRTHVWRPAHIVTWLRRDRGQALAAGYGQRFNRRRLTTLNARRSGRP